MSTTHRMDGPLLPGYHHMGDRGQGVLAETIPGTGLNGPAIPYPSLSFPADNGKEIMISILTVPPLLTYFAVDERGAVEAEGPPGIHEGLWAGWADGVAFSPAGSAAFFIIIGSSGSVTGNLVTDGAAASGSISVNAVSQLGGAVQLDNAQPGGDVRGYVEPVAIIGKRVVIVGARTTPVQLDGLDVAEVDDIAFRFGSALLADETVSSYTFSAEPRVGEDATPYPLIVGTPQKFGSDCIQRVSGAIGVPGVTYLLRCTGLLSSGRTLVGRAYLRIVRAR